MTGQDASFLYNETPRQHMHTLKIAVLDPSTVPGGYSFEKVKEALAARLHLLPPFRRRVVRVPLDLHHPLWVEDPDFDLDTHVHRAVVPPPGGRDEFDDLISEIASYPLDPRRPLWEIWVVEGMEEGHVGFVAKMHHSIADGVMAAEMLANVLTTDPGALDPAPPAQPWTPDEVPSRLRLTLDALVDVLKVVLGLPALLARTVRGLLAVSRHKRTAEVRPPAPFSGPNCSFNRALTPHRRFVTATLPLSEVKDVKSAFGVTVNDVILELCAGALRAYLDERDELPDKPLVAGVPVSTRQPDTRLRPERPSERAVLRPERPSERAEMRNNSVSNMFTALPVQLADPVERLRAVHEVTKGAKEQFNLLGVDMLSDWLEVTPPKPYAAFIRLYGRLGLADRHRPPINLIVSNVPGPQDDLFIAGARLVAIYSVGPILENVGLNVTVWSYRDALNVGIIGVREHVPDLRRLCSLLHDELEQLKKAAVAA
ncbi:MAG: WS/DGAT/MGAT family O-acyltransferase [Actinomycetota bacterium]